MGGYGQYLWVSVGGGLGALARYVLGIWVASRAGTAFPWSTFLINVTGSLVIGVLLTLLTERATAAPAWRLFLVVGFLGGYTTFSSYTFEAVALLQAGELRRAGWYVFGSNGVGLVACAVGVLLARLLTVERA
jgi:CrcB protein